MMMMLVLVMVLVMVVVILMLQLMMMTGHISSCVVIMRGASRGAGRLGRRSKLHDLYKQFV